ncbi:ubiquitin-protein ligase [Lithospermum erythrorhizon]|uniref:Ubiquitin-protein ligase n=1 Tax=Lithospermum erythrorhizon TaxID=34254 RepID=A0AAV3PLD3_LITER
MLSPPPVSNPQLPTVSSGYSVVHNIISYDSNMMLVAIISLLLVILFVLLLHVYAKWFLVQAAQRGGTRGAVSVPRVLGARFHHHFHTFSADTTFSTSPSKGLEASVISTIPQFVYRSDERLRVLECVICLCVFENEEIGRKLPKCEHVFHVECIDMWLHSHTTCPTCRGPAICDNKFSNINNERGEHDQELSEVAVEELEIVVVEGTIEGTENVATNDTLPVCSSSSSQEPDSIGASLKRMMSRSKCVGKIHPSGNVIEHLPEREEQGP